MEPTTPQGTGVTPTSNVRRHRTLQAVLLFFLVLLLLLIGATLTGAFGAKTTVSSTNATATAKAGGFTGFASGDGSSVLSNTITAASGTPISLTPGSTANGSSTNGSTDANGSATGASTDANGNATGGSTDGGTTGSLPGGTNSNPSGASSSTGSTGATGSSTDGSTGGSTGNGSGLATSLPGGSNSSTGANGSSNSSANGSTGGSTANGSTGSSTGNSSATGSSNGSNGTTGNNAAGGNGPTPHLGNYVCTIGEPGNLIYQSDFTLLEGLKYKHSSNPSQEFSFSYDPSTQSIHWLDGPNAGTVGSYYLSNDTQPYRIVEQFPNNPQAAPVSCSLAVTK